MSPVGWYNHNKQGPRALPPSNVTTSVPGCCIWVDSNGSVRHTPHDYEIIFNPHTLKPDERRCIHCGHTKNLDRKDNKMGYNLYRIEKGEDPHLLHASTNPSLLRDEAEEYAKMYHSRGYTYIVAYGEWTTREEETITDEDGKEYTVDRAPNNLIRITAPCGQAQTFSRKDLQAMLDD